MANEDNTQHLHNSNSQVIAAIRALEDRIINVEGIIVARLNDTRPLEQQMLVRIDELSAPVNEIRIGQAATLEKIATIQGEVTAFRGDFEGFRRETNDNFRLVNDKLDVLNDDVLTVRARQRDLEKRVTRLEQEPIESAA
ncbi:MAG TPA: hypothetical protein VKE91_00370 [Blastocatellia bacterium]|nr:hypothetical protein [Blastocatellia bacterium]